MKKISLILFCFISLYCCKQNPYITFVNNSNRVLVYRQEITLYNDTTISLEQCDKGSLYDIAPNSEYPFIASGLLWERYFKHNPQNSVHLYVTYADTLQKYGKCEVLKKRIFEKTYNITYEDAKRMNWRIVFDGK